MTGSLLAPFPSPVCHPTDPSLSQRIRIEFRPAVERDLDSASTLALEVALRSRPRPQLPLALTGVLAANMAEAN